MNSSHKSVFGGFRFGGSVFVFISECWLKSKAVPICVKAKYICARLMQLLHHLSVPFEQLPLKVDRLEIHN